TVVRSRCQTLGIAEDFHEKKDIHIHVPEGTILGRGPFGHMNVDVLFLVEVLGDTQRLAATAHDRDYHTPLRSVSKRTRSVRIRDVGSRKVVY
ncbi:MAG: S16 family serine protease, partial [Bacteroidales bacterium]